MYELLLESYNDFRPNNLFKPENSSVSLINYIIINGKSLRASNKSAILLAHENFSKVLFGMLSSLLALQECSIEVTDAM